ncbi:MAG: PHB depolymerase family esterase [bacterium]
MRIGKALVFLCLLWMTACGSSTSGQPAPALLSPGDYNQTLFAGGVQRRYILHVPSGYDGSKALPLLFVLHGHGGSAEAMRQSTGFNQKADEESFFVAYLQGTLGSDGVPGWNTGISPGLDINVDDVDFVRMVASQLQGQVIVDANRIYAAGFSNGGMMSHRLGAELSDLLAGVAVVEGTIGVRQPDGTFLTTSIPMGPIPVLMIHGKQDATLPYEGGPSGVGEHLEVKSAADAVAFWNQADVCAGSAQTQTSVDGNTITADYAACAFGSEVELITLVNGIHQWPNPGNPGEISGSDAVWDFFARHSKS